MANKYRCARCGGSGEEPEPNPRGIEPMSNHSKRKPSCYITDADGNRTGLYAEDLYQAANERITELEGLLGNLLAKRKSIETDVRSAHHNRGPGASGWMREDDRDFRADLSNLFDDLEAALPASNE